MAPPLEAEGVAAEGNSALTDASASAGAIALPPLEHSPRGTLGDVAAVRAALTGTSSVDATRLIMADRDQVDHFLRLHQFDTDNPLDLRRLRALHQDATIYLTETHGYQLPQSVLEVDEVHDLFLAAANGPVRLQRYACLVLKVMHIIHHLATREIVYETAISEADLLARLNSKVFRAIDEMRSTGVVVEEFSTGAKARTSLITKLLAKRSTLAAAVYDKMRFRVVLASRDDLVMALVYLMRNLVPFNFVIPEQSQNDLVRVDDLARVLGLDPSEVARIWEDGPEPVTATLRNEFSGSTYRCINFVADIPIRIDDVAPKSPPAIAIVQAEIQLLDAATAADNEKGENAHHLYKERQRERVRLRLEGAAAGRLPLSRRPLTEPLR